MPVSNADSIPTVLDFVRLAHPRRILDVGVGVGVYGLLIRSIFDILPTGMARTQWQLRLEGVEIFPAYLNPVWDYAYDQVHLADARQLPFAADSFDVVLIADVLEHLPKTEALACVRRLLEIAPVVIVSTPVRHLEQGAWGGNIHETHRSVLSPRDLPHLACVKTTGITFCAVCCRDRWQSLRFRLLSGGTPVARREFFPSLLYRLTLLARPVARRFFRPAA